jgi:DNA-binding NtrC family response regulator
LTEQPTRTLAQRDPRRVHRWALRVTAGPSQGAAVVVEQGTVRVGSAPANDLVVDDERVSRRHLEIEIRPDGPIVRDLGSKNGTLFAGSRIEAVALPLGGGVLLLGDSELTLRPVEEPGAPSEPPARDRLVRLVGASRPMRELYGLIERLAPSSATVLVQGESGSGKELVADAMHELGPRRQRPFVVVDCGAVAPALLESHLFGHVRGAFTGAVRDVAGAFRDADGGTLLLDEVGELALDLQPKLLRVLENKQVTPVGDTARVDVDVRVIASTHRELAAQVASGQFRQDLYYRLSVVTVRVPPLRARLDDLPLLVDHFLREAGAPPLGAESLATLAAYDWPGNVRQLRNVLAHAGAVGAGTIRPADLDTPAARVSPSALLRVPYKQAKDQVVAGFTREYMEALLDRHGGNASAAAREAQLDRNWLVAIARRAGVRVRD